MKAKLFIYPTDTVWGIGGSVFDQDVYHAINQVKKEPDLKPLSVLFSSMQQLQQFIDLPQEGNWSEFFKLETTLLLPHQRSRDLPTWIWGESSLIGIRLLEFPLIQQISRLAGDTPIFTTSLNLKGEPAITNFKAAQAFQQEHATEAWLPSLAELKGLSLSGVSSTLVKWSKESFSILRTGQYQESIKNFKLPSENGDR